MMAKLTMDYRRLAAWAAVLALVVALLVAVLGPVLAQHRRYDAEIARDRQVFERLTRLEVSRDRIHDATRRYKEENLASLVYSQETPSAQIALDVQKRVTEILDKSGAEVKTVAAYNLPVDDFQGSGIKVTFTGSMEAVATALHEIEAGRPLLVIEEMDMKPLMQGRMMRGAQQQAAPQSVQVQLAVVSYTPLERKQG